MKAKELRTKTDAELLEMLKKANQKIAESTFHHLRARSKNVKEVRELRRERARILTLIKEKQS
jgi:ribosomal protein L29